jgi:hypothetical protein
VQIQINTDHNIRNDDALTKWASGVIQSALTHSQDHITRVEAHLGDENGRKSGQNDKRCMLEARLEGRRPVTVTEHAATIDLAVNGAVGKLARMIESITGRAADK